MTKAHLQKAEILGALMRCEIERKQLEQRIALLHLGVSRLLRSHREKKGISLREIARRMGLSAPYVSDVELGRRAPTIAFADDFMEALNQ